MALAFDAVGPSAAGSASTTSPWTWNHTVTGTSTLLLAGFTNANGSTPSSVTYGAQAMTLVTKISSGTTTNQVWLYKLVGATAGTAAVTVTVATPGQLTGGSVSFTGADQAAGIGTPFTNTGTSASATVAVTSNTSGNLIFGFVGSGAADTSTSAPGTQRFQNNASSNFHAGNASGQTAPATGSTVTLTEVITSDDWGFIAVEVLAAPSGVPTGLATGTGAALNPSIVTSTVTIGPRYAGTAADLGGVYGSWGTPQYATGGP